MKESEKLKVPYRHAIRSILVLPESAANAIIYDLSGLLLLHKEGMVSEFTNALRLVCLPKTLAFADAFYSWQSDDCDENNLAFPLSTFSMLERHSPGCFRNAEEIESLSLYSLTQDELQTFLQSQILLLPVAQTSLALSNKTFLSSLLARFGQTEALILFPREVGVLSLSLIIQTEPFIRAKHATTQLFPLSNLKCWLLHKEFTF